jgi:CYTH domain-containing protein
MKYARVEIERRFLIDVVPAEAVEPTKITDHYITGTHLRLRKVEEPDGPTVYKLAHKQRPDADVGTVVLHTTIYLTEAEYTLLLSLPARELRKTRAHIALDQHAGIVDAFEGALEGLVVLEVGFESREERDAFSPPAWAGAETTLSGGELASMSSDELAARVAAARTPPDSAR